jgi:cofilin
VISLAFYRSPENAPVKSKMLYAGSKDALTRVLLAVGVKCQATDYSELTSDLLLQSILKV